jgi:hypothetical protein
VAQAAQPATVGEPGKRGFDQRICDWVRAFICRTSGSALMNDGVNTIQDHKTTGLQNHGTMGLQNPGTAGPLAIAIAAPPPPPEPVTDMRWGMQHTKVYSMISAAQVYTTIAALPDLPKPEHESQLRPLLGLAPEEIMIAWQTAAEHCKGQPITARLVKNVVRALQLGNQVSVEPGRRGPNRVEIWKGINAKFGDLLKLISTKAAHEQILSLIQDLHGQVRLLYEVKR